MLLVDGKMWAVHRDFHDILYCHLSELIAAKFDSSKKRKKKVGRPLTDCELEALIYFKSVNETHGGAMIGLPVHLPI